MRLVLELLLYIAIGAAAGWGGVKAWEWLEGRKNSTSDEFDTLAFQRAYLNSWTTAPRTAGSIQLHHSLSSPVGRVDAVPVEKRTDPIVGWRFWSLDWQDLILKAYDDWEGPEKVARHVHRSDVLTWMPTLSDHIASPHPGCMCGINALKAEGVYPYLIENVGHKFTVVGRVELAGTVDEYERGYRAEKGRIIELVILAEQVGSRILDKLEERYGVRPTVQKPDDWLEEMEVIYGLGEAYQETRGRAGTLATIRTASRATGTRARQDRSLSSYQASLKGMGFVNYWHSPSEITDLSDS